ncbi:MAG: ABC transporter substrate-binding protein [Helicobacteraceae bacterium]|nr:ABC transporter substrate-binding protein [Helicobacteraceae bacterium]
MKTLLRSFLALCLVCVASFALEFSKINSTMDTNINKILSILEKLPPKSTQEQTHNKEQIKAIADEIFIIFDPIFDYDLIAKLALGGHYKTLSKEQLDSFKTTFIDSLKRSFVDKLQLYKDEKLEVKGGEKIKENRYNLKVSIFFDNKENYIIFKFYPKDSDDWRIYDVDVLGVSVLQTYRSQISDILSKNSFPTLLEKLQGEINFDTK